MNKEQLEKLKTNDWNKINAPAEIQGEALVCVKWGQQRTECEERPCVGCGEKLAVSKRNIPRCERDGIAPICIGCAKALAEEHTGNKQSLAIGGMVGGETAPLQISKDKLFNLLDQFEQDPTRKPK